MPADRREIYVGEALAANPLVPLLGGYTHAVNALADLYAELVRRERPELTLDEWEAVVVANNGVWHSLIAREIPMLQLIGELAESPEWQEPEIAERDPSHGSDIDAARVNQILTSLSFGGRLAVLHVVMRAWASEGGASRRTIEEALR